MEIKIEDEDFLDYLQNGPEAECQEDDGYTDVDQARAEGFHAGLWFAIMSMVAANDEM